MVESLPAYPALALATVTGTAGSTPQKSGCSALFCEQGLLSGTIGGGMVEGKVMSIIQHTLPSARSEYLHFDLDKDIRYEQDAICGGYMNVLIDAAPGLHQKTFEKLSLSLQKGIPGVLITQAAIPAEQNVDIKRYWISMDDTEWRTDPEFQRIDPRVKEVLASGFPVDYMEFLPSPGGQEVRIFMEPLVPPPRLVIAGAGHIGKALAHLGNLLDFEVTVVDDREEFVGSGHIPDADHLVLGNIGKVMEQLKKTSDTYIVIVTRGHKDDADALKACLGAGVAYIGMIGSARKIALMRERFLNEGWTTPEQWEKIHAPIGLPIHSQTVQEIAVSIAAQLVQVRNGKLQSHG